MLAGSQMNHGYQDKEFDGADSEAAKRRRVPPDVAFPYADLDVCIDVATTIKRELGLKGTSDQVSGVLGVKGGAFLRRLGAARIFGLIERDGSDWRLTELGKRIISPNNAQARAESFLSVPLFMKLYEDFRGSSLPADSGIEHHMRSLGVSEKSTETARQIFKKSARQAGFFSLREDQLIMPVFRVSEEEEGLQHLPAGETSEGNPDRANDSPPSPPSTPSGFHPALLHALETLPKQGAEWGYEDLEDWLDGFKGVLRLVYKVKRPKGF